MNRIWFGEGNGNPLQYSCLEIPRTEEPGRLQSMGSRRVGHDWATSLSLFTFMHWRREMATHSSVLAWRIPGTGELGGLPSMGSHRVRHEWSNLAAAADKNHGFPLCWSVTRKWLAQFQDLVNVKESAACNAGDLGSIYGLGKSPGEGNGYPLQYSCLENPMYRGAWQATVPEITKSWSQLSV